MAPMMLPRPQLASLVVALALTACASHGRFQAAPAPAPPATAAPALGLGGDRSAPVLALGGGQELLLLTDPSADAQALAQGLGASLLSELPLDGQRVLRMRLAEGQGAAVAAQAARALPGVLSASPNQKLTSFAATNDTAYARQWGHRPEYADAEGGWAALGSTDLSKVIVAVLDSGVDANHPELAGRVEPTIHQDSAATGAPDDKDHYGHGTFCAGVVAAAGNNNQGVAGLAWGARILPVKLGPGANFDVYDAIAGIARACDYRPASGARVRVVNMSFGVPQGAVDPLYEAAVAYARRRGVLLVAAVGNDGQNTIASPANTPGVLAVGATSLSRDWEVIAPFSNYGERLDLVAPGGLTFGTFPMDNNPACELCMNQPGYGLNSGTSFAAPYVAGVAALAFAKFDPNHLSLADANAAAARVDAVRDHLLASCDDLGPPGREPVFGHGRINVRKAVSASSLQKP